MTRKTSRRGAALLFVAICLAATAALMTAVVHNGMEQRRYLARRDNQLQAYWLAQAGIEHAAARLLLADPQAFVETLEIVPQSEVRIVVKKQKDDTFQVTSVSSFPKGDTLPATATASRSFKLNKGVLEATK